MKKLCAILLIAVTLFSIGIMNSCSCTGCGGSLKGAVVDYSVTEAVEDTRNWLADTYANGDTKIIDKKFQYYILPSENNSPCFIRYYLSNISSRDVLVFKGGEVKVIDEDSYDELRRYNEIFTIDITDVNNTELIKQKGCLTNIKNGKVKK